MDPIRPKKFDILPPETPKIGPFPQVKDPLQEAKEAVENSLKNAMDLFDKARQATDPNGPMMPPDETGQRYRTRHHEADVMDIEVGRRLAEEDAADAAGDEKRDQFQEVRDSVRAAIDTIESQIKKNIRG